MLALPIMQARQKVQQVKASTSVLYKKPITHPKAMNDTKGNGQGRDQLAEHMQTKGMGRVPKHIPAPLSDTPTRKHGKVLSKIDSRESGFRDLASHQRKQQATGSTVYTDGS